MRGLLFVAVLFFALGCAEEDRRSNSQPRFNPYQGGPAPTQYYPGVIPTGQCFQSPYYGCYVCRYSCYGAYYNLCLRRYY